MSFVIGLTGQSGAGKTTVCDTLKESGFAIINCDLTARKVTSDGSECNHKLSYVFPMCFDDDLKLDRHKLANEVFSDKEKLQQLDNIIYPYIIKQINDEIKILSGQYDYIILDAPTLFEAGADKICDKIISVIADKDIRSERIHKRDKISSEEIEKRFSSQYDEKFFIENSDYIIRNNSDLENAVKQTKEIANAIKGSF